MIKNKKKQLSILYLAAAIIIMLLCTGCGTSAKDTSKSAETRAAEGTLTCQLTINCKKAVDSDKLGASKKKVLPADGIIYPKKKVEFQEGDTVYDVLKRETRDNKIHMESAESPLYESQYIEGIANLYEFDCGDTSGWVYSVNGEFPRYGCSKYELKKGDNIKWIYSCNLGKDVGGGNFEE